MSTRSKRKTAQRRLELTERAIADREAGTRYLPASQRDIDPYPSDAPKPLKYSKDRFGITLKFSTNRRERRANARG